VPRRGSRFAEFLSFLTTVGRLGLEMEMPHTVLLVDPDPQTRLHFARGLSDAGFLVTACDSFERAFPRLQLVAPDVLVTAARLGAYNGVHLVIRGRADYPTMKSIVFDTVFDVAIGSDAMAEGALYVERPQSIPEIVRLVREAVAARPERVPTPVERKWPRKELSRPVLGRLGESDMRILDLSYGGLRIELAPATDEALMKGAVAVFVPDVGVCVATTPIWTRRARPGSPWWCGVAVQAADTPEFTAWQKFVDGVS
jgi:ActR/RegA family two-component response regulator